MIGIPQHLIEKYIHACRYNSRVSTKESDQSQRVARRDVMKCCIFMPGTDAYTWFAHDLDRLSEDCLTQE